MHESEIILLDRDRAIHRRFCGLVLETKSGIKSYPDFAGRIVIPRMKTDPLWIMRSHALGKPSLVDRIRLQGIGAAAGALIHYGVTHLL